METWLTRLFPLIAPASRSAAPRRGAPGLSLTLVLWRRLLGGLPLFRRSQLRQDLNLSY